SGSSASTASEELRQGLDFGQGVPMPALKEMVDVIVDQRPLRLGHRPLHRVQLGGKVKAGSAILDHADDAVQMPLGAFQPSSDGGVACMAVRVWHRMTITPLGG